LNFDYNGKGERVNKFGVGTARPSHYVYNESDAVAILKGAGLDRANSGVQNIIYIDQLPVGVLDNGLLLPIETDHLGTPRVVSDGNQAIWRWDLITGNASTGGSNAFGDRPANQDPDGNGKSYRFDLRFPGQIHDPETQLNYNYFRDYEPGTGRYVESDPIGLEGGLNTYLYGLAGPFRFIDPLGLYPGEDALRCFLGPHPETCLQRNPPQEPTNWYPDPYTPAPRPIPFPDTHEITPGQCKFVCNSVAFGLPCGATASAAGGWSAYVLTVPLYIGCRGLGMQVCQWVCDPTPNCGAVP